MGFSFRFIIILITGFLSRFSVKGYQAIGNPFLSAYKPVQSILGVSNESR
jgi:hypothetical protein